MLIIRKIIATFAVILTKQGGYNRKNEKTLSAKRSGRRAVQS